MLPLKDSYNTYTFNHEEQEVIKQYLSSDVMRAYLCSTYAQLRDELLDQNAISSNGQSIAPHILALINGAEEYLTQILRAGE